MTLLQDLRSLCCGSTTGITGNSTWHLFPPLITFNTIESAE